MCEFRESLKLYNKKNSSAELLKKMHSRALWVPSQESPACINMTMPRHTSNIHRGLGAYLELETDTGLWVPISFASRFLNSAELI